MTIVVTVLVLLFGMIGLMLLGLKVALLVLDYVKEDDDVIYTTRTPVPELVQTGENEEGNLVETYDVSEMAFDEISLFVADKTFFGDHEHGTYSTLDGHGFLHITYE